MAIRNRADKRCDAEGIEAINEGSKGDRGVVVEIGSKRMLVWVENERFSDDDVIGIISVSMGIPLDKVEEMLESGALKIANITVSGLVHDIEGFVDAAVKDMAGASGADRDIERRMIEAVARHIATEGPDVMDLTDDTDYQVRAAIDAIMDDPDGFLYYSAKCAELRRELEKEILAIDDKEPGTYSIPKVYAKTFEGATSEREEIEDIVAESVESVMPFIFDRYIGNMNETGIKGLVSLAQDMLI